MLMLVGGFVGVVLMPFVVLLLPFLIWYALPIVLFLGALHLARGLKRPRTRVRLAVRS
jgi:hypothetical protein